MSFEVGRLSMEEVVFGCSWMLMIVVFGVSVFLMGFVCGLKMCGIDLLV